MNSPVFIILSFEGPDRYSHAGGLGSRIRELSVNLARTGYETHLFFIGDPALPGSEVQESGMLHLHRWSQWISAYHPGGVYDGEEGKARDWDASIAPWLETELLPGKVAAGTDVVVLAEEWQTFGSVLALRKAVARNGWDRKVHIFWNLNNPFGTERIDWRALDRSAVITTVSRYMKHFMWKFGVDARVIPNGVSESWFETPDSAAVADLSTVLADRLLLVKVARWDPDKRWNMAVDAVGLMKRQGLRPLLLARGGVEDHGKEVLSRARGLGLSVQPATWQGNGTGSLVRAVHGASGADVIDLRGYLDQPQLKVLYRSADAVLANSGIEPFGLVGLEVMASGGLAFVGSTGEDYATSGHDCIAVQTHMPDEIAYHAAYMKAFSAVSRSIRGNAMQTALRYTWTAVVQRSLMPMIAELSGAAQLPARLDEIPESALAGPVASAAPVRPGERAQVLLQRGAGPARTATPRSREPALAG